MRHVHLSASESLGGFVFQVQFLLLASKCMHVKAKLRVHPVLDIFKDHQNKKSTKQKQQLSFNTPFWITHEGALFMRGLLYYTPSVIGRRVLTISSGWLASCVGQSEVPASRFFLFFLVLFHLFIIIINFTLYFKLTFLLKQQPPLQLPKKRGPIQGLSHICAHHPRVCKTPNSLIGQ